MSGARGGRRIPETLKMKFIIGEGGSNIREMEAESTSMSPRQSSWNV